MNARSNAPAHPSLLNRNFVLLWQGQLVSQVGTQTFLVAMLLWLKQATGSATVIGLVLMLSTLPGVLLGPVGGAVADRVSRRRLLIAADLTRGVVFLALAAAMLTLPGHSRGLLACLFAASLVAGVCSAVFQPAGQSFLPDLVPPEHLPGANSLMQGSFQVMALVAQGLGGILFRVVGAPLLALLDGVSFLYSALSSVFIRAEEHLSRSTAPAAARWRVLAQDVASGFRYVGGRAGMRRLFVVIGAAKLFSVPFTLLLPFFVEGALGARADWYGFLLAGYGGGSVVGFGLAGALRLSGAGRGRLLAVALVAQAASLTTLAFATSTWAALALLVAAGACDGLIYVSLISILQVGTPGEFRGRVFGVLKMVSEALTPLSMALAGIVADLVGHNVPLLYLVCGAALLAAAVFVVANEECRRFLAGEAERRMAGPVDAVGGVTSVAA